MNKKEAEWEVKINLGGKQIMTSRTDEKTAKAVGKSIGLDVEAGQTIKWPFTIRKVGQKSVLEENALAQAVAPKFQVNPGDFMIMLTGTKAKPGESPHTNWHGIENELQFLLERFPQLRDYHWQTAAVDAGTVFGGE